MRTLLVLAALSGFLAVAFGAFAAHGADAHAAELLRTGAQYQIVHALAAFACFCVTPTRRLAPGLFLVGTLLFAGSLYALAFGAPGVVGAITPLGGLCFLAGWLALAWSAWKRPAS
jgi:uncharacterized membrane protein YgdD (TMEM256/DUF423 family)